MGSKYTSWDYKKGKDKNTFALFFLEATVQSWTFPLPSRSTGRLLKKSCLLISTKSYSFGLLDFQDY